MTFISKYCSDEICARCNEQATSKIKEVVFDDDKRDRTAIGIFLCDRCFELLLDPSSVIIPEEKYEQLRLKANCFYMDIAMFNINGKKTEPN